MRHFNFFKNLSLLAITIIVSNLSLTAQVQDSVCYNAAPNPFISTAPATGGDSLYTYLWQDSISGSTWASAPGTNNTLVYQPAALTQTTYFRRKVSSTSCGEAYSNVLTVMVIDSLDTTSTSISHVTCNGISDGSISITLTGGVAPYNYAWSNGATTSTISAIAAGTYTVTATDAYACNNVVLSFTITEPAALVASATADSNVSCNGLSDAGATASVTGGTALYTYAWSNGDISSSITGVAAGTYSVTVTDANGCYDSASVTLTEPAVLMASSTVDSNVTCNGLTNGGATATATGGTATYSYLWSNAATSANITAVGAGTYSVTITDANGCTDSSSVTITEPTSLIASSVVDSNASCNGLSDGGATASATGGTASYTYLWSNSVTTSSITGVAAGTYSVTITDVNGCTDSSSVTITEPASLVASSMADSNISCNGLSDGGATASATGGTASYAYLWSNSTTTASITGVAAGTYSVTITDINGCTDSASVTITEPALLIASSVADSNASCNGYSDAGATATATGGTTNYTYAWSNGDVTSFITGVAAGTYSVTITDANGCTDSASITLTEPTTLIASTLLDSNATCNGFTNGGATASATGGTALYSYLWSNTTTTASISGVGAGTYSVTVTDANGCTDSASVVVNEPTTLVASSAVTSNYNGFDISCNSAADGEITASATGGTTTYSYAWSNAATTALINSLTAGTYTVTITDANGCTDASSVTIAEPTAISSTVTVDSNVSCFGFANGGLTASGNGGAGSYTYSWSNAATTASITGVAANTFYVTVSDVNGCITLDTGIVSEPNQLTLTTSVSNVTCNGGNDGAVDLTVAGGTPNYTFNWNNSATTEDITGVAAGTYNVTVTDANGCIENTSATVTEPGILTGGSIITGN